MSDVTSLTASASDRFGFDPAPVTFLEDGAITSIPGVRAGAIGSGVRSGGALDLAIVDLGARGAAAGVFTANKATAAPVIVSREHLADGSARAVIANSGCANACTGETGIDHSRKMAAAAAKLLGCDATDVLVASTGLIGYYLPIETMIDSIAGAELNEGVEHGHSAARAIMTTDTIPKSVAVTLSIAGSEVTIGAMAKGAAMLAPSMATMLAFIVTDAAISAMPLKVALSEAVSATFNRISVDACQSTNDTVVALSTCAASHSLIESESSAGFSEFAAGLREVCGALAEAMIRDGEGATRTAEVRVSGAASDSEALQAARAICSSVLVRCSLYGADPYWGRIVSEVGASGVSFDPDRVSVAYGGVQVARGGVAAAHDAEAVARHMTESEVSIECDLGLGSGVAKMITCDLGPEYIDENMGTS